MPPPPRGGEDAPPRDSEADSDDDDGLGGLRVDEEPVAIGGRGPQRDSRPDEDQDHKLGLAHIEYRLDRQSNFSAAKPREGVPGKGQPLSRTTQNLDAMECYEDR
eukprot:3540127-Pyramimonas_sp.AAC.1